MARKESMYLQTEIQASVQKNQLSVDDGKGWIPQQQGCCHILQSALSELDLKPFWCPQEDYGGHASLAVLVCAHLLEFMLSPGAQETSRCVGSTLSNNGSVFWG